MLDALHHAADGAGRLFPLSLASQGSCQIGGNLSSNAGGTGVLAYGNARELCLGVEVVLPTGEVLDDLRKLKKDNTGYDLKNLFVGAEGTLGVITAAVLKLFPKPKGREVAFAALQSPAGRARPVQPRPRPRRLRPDRLRTDRQPAAGVRARPYSADGASAGRALALVCADRNLVGPLGRGCAPAGRGHSRRGADRRAGRRRGRWRAAWRRPTPSGGCAKACRMRSAPEGASIKHDISVPVARIPEFIARADKAVAAVSPDARIVCFGHMGDGNLHYNVSQPAGGDAKAFLALYRTMNKAVHDIVRELDGSISAEHGIGQLKRDELAATAPPVALDLMRRIKAAFDPAGIMNPGKVI